MTRWTWGRATTPPSPAGHGQHPGRWHRTEHPGSLASVSTRWKPAVGSSTTPPRSARATSARVSCGGTSTSFSYRPLRIRPTTNHLPRLGQGRGDKRLQCIARVLGARPDIRSIEIGRRCRPRTRSIGILGPVDGGPGRDRLDLAGFGDGRSALTDASHPSAPRKRHLGLQPWPRAGPRLRGPGGRRFRRRIASRQRAGEHSHRRAGVLDQDGGPWGFRRAHRSTSRQVRPEQG